MNPLWIYQDYVDHLTHPNNLVRMWAFDALEKRYPRRFTKEVSSLIGDSDKHLACMAPLYLASHNAIFAAPTILKCFQEHEGRVAGRCATALGDMRYEPAVENMLERLRFCKDADMLLGIVHYLSMIRRDDCHRALQNIFTRMRDDIFGNWIATSLLKHRDPEDVPLVLGNCLNTTVKDFDLDRFSRRLLVSVGATELYDDLSSYSRQNLLEAPRKALQGLQKQNPMINPSLKIIDDIISLIKKSEYQHIATILMFNARNIVNNRFPENEPKKHLVEIYEQDLLALSFLEEFSKQSSLWKHAGNDKSIGRKLVSMVFACYFSIQVRGGYLSALNPEASVEELISALKRTGPEFPETLQDRIIELAPVAELKGALSDELWTWGDNWTVKLMGRIGDKAFVSDLIRVLDDTAEDPLADIHENALVSLRGMDESAHESIISAIENEELTDALDIISVIEHLPYSESFDIAYRLWNDDSVDSFELYARCLERIGNFRGIKSLQDIFSENNAIYLGDSLEVLSRLHGVDIPELPIIQRERIARIERQKKRKAELDELAQRVAELKTFNKLPGDSNVTTPEHKIVKIGRNAPCPCGSGKKYKHCCLNKNS